MVGDQSHNEDADCEDEDDDVEVEQVRSREWKDSPTPDRESLNIDDVHNSLGTSK